jgi:diguanylate cyclase (GGDEF)-like protein/PAS domain S-box-containing protein
VLAESSTDVIVRLDSDFRRRYVSPACHDLLGYDPAELVGGHPRETVHPDDWPALQAELTCIGKGEQSLGLTYRCRHKNGSYIWPELRGRNLGGSGFVVVLRDITLRKHAEQQLAEANRTLEMLALQDALTGLANRRAFDDALLREFRRTVREATPLALVLIDADHFKNYNDIYGHPAGDAALCAIANAVRRSLRRSGDFAARCGGEEIVVLLPSTDQGGAKALAERIRQQVRSLDLEHVGSPHGIVTVRAGAAAIHPATYRGGRPAELLDVADHALYAGKASGRDQVRSLSVGPQLVPAATLEGPRPPVWPN